jgi:small subunit ribosomal protein S6e
MAVGQQGEFVAVVNDTDPTSGGKSYSLKISGNNHAQLLGKKIGDTVDGIFVGEGEQTLSGYKLQITGGSDKTGTPLRRDLDGGSRQAVLVTQSVGFKGHNLVFKTKVAKRSDSATSQTVCASVDSSVATPSTKTHVKSTSRSSNQATSPSLTSSLQVAKKHRSETREGNRKNGVMEAWHERFQHNHKSTSASSVTLTTAKPHSPKLFLAFGLIHTPKNESVVSRLNSAMQTRLSTKPRTVNSTQLGEDLTDLRR